MASVSEGISQRRGGGAAAFFAVIALSIWQLRQTWRFIVLTGVGMIAAIVLVCTGPLYSQVALNASLRDFIQADSTANATISINGGISPVSADSAAQATAELNQDLTQDVGSAVSTTPLFSTQTPILSLLQGNYNVPPTTTNTSGSEVMLYGYPQHAIADHVKLVSGQLPQTAPVSGDVIDIAITPDMAQSMQLHVGDVFYTSPPAYTFTDPTTAWTVRVVGLFTPRSASDPFWQGGSFQSTIQGGTQSGVFYAGVLTSVEQVEKAFARPEVTEAPTFYWNYSINPAQVDAAHLGKVVSGLHTFLANASSNNVVSIASTTSPVDSLSAYNDRMALAQVSVGLLLILVVGMVLLFISLMADLLIEQRVEAIALLRSRGASRRQVFGVFAAQCLGLGVLALVVGPLLAFPVTRYLLQYFLPASDRVTLNSSLSGMVAALQQVWGYAVVAVLVILLAMLLALFRETRFDVLALRRESARSTRKPLWQRIYLDVLIALLAVVGYSYSLYAASETSLTAQASTQTFAPLTLLSAACILVAAILLFLRFFPILLRWATALASRRGSVASMLALAQMARSPQRALRTTLLFTLSTAFAIFTLIFMATQSQRIVDVASYEAGADFSAQVAQTTQTTLSQTRLYKHIPGVSSASVGFVTDLSNSDSFTATVKAVDADTFEQTAVWTSQDSSQPLKSLLKELTSQRKQAQHTYIIPAIVDSTTWQALHLKKGAIFTLSLYFANPKFNAQLSTAGISQQSASAVLNPYFMAVDQVQHIPTLTDMVQVDSDATSPDSSGDQGNLLVDYRSFAAAYQYYAKPVLQNPQTSFIPTTLPLNYVWLQTKNNANLSLIRSIMQKKLAPNTVLFDRATLIDSLQHDPFYLDLLGVLTLGTITPLLLALLSSLLTSWLTAYSRLTIFALLRALGSAPRQLAGVLSWEQGIVYTIMFILGILAGAVLSSIVLPVLIITDLALIGGASKTISGVNLLTILPAIHIVLPVALWIILGLLLGISVVALTMMVLMVSRPSISQTLRLNAD